MKNIREFIEYNLLRGITAFLLAFPQDYSLALARDLGNIIYFFPTKFRKRGLKHLQMAYPSKTPAEIKRILKGVFEHFIMVALEIISFPRKIHKHNYRNYIEIKGLNLIDEGLRQGNGVIMIASHFGNWDLSGHILSMLGYKVNAVARFLPNKAVDEFLNYSRRYQGEKIIYKENAIKDMMRVLKRNELLAIVSDQDARDGGIFVDFMGQKSSTIHSPALLHLKLGSSLVMLNCYRSKTNRFYYTLDFSPCIPGKEDTAEDITQQFTSLIEKSISERPEQWLWFHKRWKTHPKA